MSDYLHLFDSWQGPSLGGFPERVLDWGLNTAGTAYTPFWRNGFVTCRDEDVLVTFWRIPALGAGDDNLSA